MRHPPDLQPSERHRPLYPAPSGTDGPNIVVAFVPAGIVVGVALLGALFGKLVPTNATVEMQGFWAPATVAVVTALTALIAMRCRVPVVEEIVPRPLLRIGAVAFAALLTWFSASAFITKGLPALLAESVDRTPTTHVVEVLATDPVCAAYRGAESRLFGAIVRSDRLGGASGSRICRLPPSVWEGLRPGDRLVLHGHQGPLAFHYERVTR